MQAPARVALEQVALAQRAQQRRIEAAAQCGEFARRVVVGCFDHDVAPASRVGLEQRQQGADAVLRRHVARAAEHHQRLAREHEPMPVGGQRGRMRTHELDESAATFAARVAATAVAEVVCGQFLGQFGLEAGSAVGEQGSGGGCRHARGGGAKRA